MCGVEHSYEELKELHKKKKCVYVTCNASGVNCIMMLGDLLRPDSQVRVSPRALEPVPHDFDMSLLYMYDINPGLVCLNSSSDDDTPMVIDAVHDDLDRDAAYEAIMNKQGWTLRKKGANVTPNGLECPIPVRLMDNGSVYSLSDDCNIGKWDIKHGPAIAVWQQPRAWNTVYKRSISYKVNIRLTLIGENMDMVLLYDKSTERHYLQQECSFFQTVNGVVKMADTSGSSAWLAEQF